MKKLIFLLIIASQLALNSCNENPYKQGKLYYTSACGNCHMENGKGLRGLIPPLAKADYLSKNRGDIPCAIRKGLKGKIIINGVEYGQQEMLAISKLSEFEIANILNYIGTSWGNNEKLWTADEVRAGLDKCP